MLNAVADMNHNDDVYSWITASNAGLVGVIHKATQGVSFIDSRYAIRRVTATHAQLLWGAYHFATGLDGTAQADFFLHNAQPDTHTLMALDIESNPNGSTVTLKVAIDFINHIKETTGRLPYVYGSNVLRDFVHRDTSGTIKSCPLWLAEYGEHLPNVPSQWAKFTLWQYTDGNQGYPPHQLAGLGGSCDLNKFNGTVDELKAVWANGFPNS